MTAKPFTTWFANRLAEVGPRSGAEVARRIGTDRASVSRWRRGQLPHVRWVDSIARAFAVDASDVHRMILDQAATDGDVDALREAQDYLRAEVQSLRMTTTLVQIESVINANRMRLLELQILLPDEFAASLREVTDDLHDLSVALKAIRLSPDHEDYELPEALMDRASAVAEGARQRSAERRLAAQPTDDQFAEAAEGGPTETQGPSQHRPSPPPEPEGP